MQSSPIRYLNKISETVQAKGVTVYHVNIGQPDIETPAILMDEIRNMEVSVLAYSPSSGLARTKDAFSAYYRSRGYAVDPEHVYMTNAGSEAILFALLAAADSGDSILVPEPFYTNYRSLAEVAGVHIKPVTTSLADNFRLPPYEELARMVDSRVKAVLFSNPGNPTGKVYDSEDMEKLRRLSEEFGIYLIADEVYSEIYYEGVSFVSALDLDDVSDHVIMVDSISKRYSACGARIGCIVSRSKTIIEHIEKLGQMRLCPPTIEQVGAAALSRLPREYYASIRERYERRRDVVCEGLRVIPGIAFHIPEGAFYTLIELPVENAKKFCEFLIGEFSFDDETVLLAPAEGFYMTPGLGVREVRMAFVLEEDKLRRTIELLGKGLQEYTRLHQNEIINMPPMPLDLVIEQSTYNWV